MPKTKTKSVITPTPMASPQNITSSPSPKKSTDGKKHIVILGAGYCGIQVALQLAKHAQRDHLKITLIDKLPYHTYLSELYETAAAFSPNHNQEFRDHLKRTLSFDLATVFKNKPVDLIIQEVANVNSESKIVKLANKQELSYDYLVVTLGSENNYYGNQEVEKHAYPLKTLENSLRLNSDLVDFFTKNQAEIGKSIKPRLAVVGGGFTGVELVSELAGLVKKLAEQYSFPAEAVEIMLIEPRNELVGLGKTVSNLAIKRLKRLGIRIELNHSVDSFDGTKLTIKVCTSDTCSNLPLNFLIWTAGIQAPSILKSSFPNLSSKYELEVRPTLEALYYPNIFVGGDNAACIDMKSKKYLPKLGQLAVQQAPVIVHNILASIHKHPLKKFKPCFKGFIVALGGKYGIYHRGIITFGGISPWSMKMMVDLRYFLSLLPFPSAMKKWYDKEKIFTKND